MVSLNPKMKTQFDAFTAGLQEGDIVHGYFEKITDNGTLLQLAKLHCMIRELASFTGNTFQGMKFEIKRRSGLFAATTMNGEPALDVKSFGDDCSMEDLNLAIQACIELGEEINYILN